MPMFPVKNSLIASILATVTGATLLAVPADDASRRRRKSAGPHEDVARRDRHRALPREGARSRSRTSSSTSTTTTTTARSSTGSSATS